MYLNLTCVDIINELQVVIQERHCMQFAETEARSSAVADESSNGKHTLYIKWVQNPETSRGIVQEVAGE